MPNLDEIGHSFDAAEARPEVAFEKGEVMQVLATTERYHRERRAPLRPGRFIEPRPAYDSFPAPISEPSD